MHREIKLSMPSDPEELEIDLAIHDVDSNTLIINYAGLGEDFNGHHDRYARLADLMQERGLGSIVRMGNMPHQNLGNQKRMNDSLRFVLDYFLAENASDPKLYLMGFSAGASSIAAVAADYPQVEKILLMAPSGDAGIGNMKRSLRVYTGEAYFATGENDEIASPEFVRELHNISYASRTKRFTTIPNCNHNFSGRDNSKVISKAPFWAFGEDETFPSPENGIVLYD